MAAPSNVVDTVMDFLDVSINAVLYARRVYPEREYSFCRGDARCGRCCSLHTPIKHLRSPPPSLYADMFTRCRKYGVATHQTSHPDLSAYIATVLSNARPLFADGSAAQLVVAIRDVASSGPRFAPRVHERFVFDVRCDAFDRGASSAAAARGPTLQEELQSALLKLILINGQLAREPRADGTVAHDVLLYAAVEPSAVDPRAWIVSSAEERRAVEIAPRGRDSAAASSAASDSCSGSGSGAHVIPIKSMASCGGASLQISVEEAAS